MSDDIDKQRLDLERQKHEDEMRLAEARLAAESKRSGGYSAGAVTLIGALIALASSSITGLLGGYWNLQIEQSKVQGQLGLEELKTTADNERLKQEQQFEILLRATEGVSPEEAAQNLLFFVDIKYIDDPTNKIREYAEKGEAPTFAAPRLPGDLTAGNPILDRMRLAAAESKFEKGGQKDFRVAYHVLVGPDGMPIDGRPTPNYSADIEDRLYVVIHFSASRSAASAINWQTHPDARASHHLIISRNGEVTQLLPFDYKAWHAGVSHWNGLTNLNSHTIAIELENAGALTRQGGKWKAWFGGEYDDVVEAVHKNESEMRGWHRYTDVQISTLTEILKALKLAYPEIRDVIGHEDISPGRKQDPGPAFPMSEVRKAVFGRSEPLAPE